MGKLELFRNTDVCYEVLELTERTFLLVIHARSEQMVDSYEPITKLTAPS